MHPVQAWPEESRNTRVCEFRLQMFILMFPKLLPLLILFASFSRTIYVCWYFQDQLLSLAINLYMFVQRGEWACSTPEDQGMVREKQYWVGNVFPSTRESEKWLWLLTGSTYAGQGAPAACLPGDS